MSEEAADLHVLVSGAGGFIGSRLADRLLADERFARARLTLLDLTVPNPPSDKRVRTLVGDIAEPAVRAEAIDGRADIVFHLAGVLGGAAESNYPLSRRINIDATLSLFEELRDEARPPRVVFASSIAVFGTTIPEHIDDDTIPLPSMVYGAQKLMMEVALTQFSGRGLLDGISIRLPGIVARPGADARLKSAFLNNVFYAYARGEDFVLPVSPEGASWLISVPTVVDAFVHAATLPREQLGERRAFTLPAQRVRMAELVQALGRRFPSSRAKIEYRPDAQLQAQFASQPPLTTAIADQLGFRHDGDLDRLVERALDSANV
jgi:nucleoside-diphosphate-sugar epimerase